MIFGLCGGLGHYLNVDPTIVRILFVLLAMPGGFGVFAYLIMSLIVPLEPGEKDIHPKEEVREFAEKIQKEAKEATAGMKKSGRCCGFRIFLGVVLIAFGVFLLARQFLPFFHMEIFFWPVLAVLFGVYLLVKEK